VESDPSLLVAGFEQWSLPLYLMHKISYGRLPRRAEFVPAAKKTGEGVVVFGNQWEHQLEVNFKAFAEEWVKKPAFKQAFAGKSAAQFVDQLFSNAGVTPEMGKRNGLIEGLEKGTETQASVLLKVIADDAVIQRERSTALVLLHYFGYLRRDPDDPPDGNWNGFNFWRAELEKGADPRGLTNAFLLSPEYVDRPR
jgi:hypothetical protein